MVFRRVALRQTSNAVFDIFWLRGENTSLHSAPPANYTMLWERLKREQDVDVPAETVPGDSQSQCNLFGKRHRAGTEHSFQIAGSIHDIVFIGDEATSECDQSASTKNLPILKEPRAPIQAVEHEYIGRLGVTVSRDSTQGSAVIECLNLNFPRDPDLTRFSAYPKAQITLRFPSSSPSNIYDDLFFDILHAGASLLKIGFIYQCASPKTFKDTDYRERELAMLTEALAKLAEAVDNGDDESPGGTGFFRVLKHQTVLNSHLLDVNRALRSFFVLSKALEVSAFTLEQFQQSSSFGSAPNNDHSYSKTAAATRLQIELLLKKVERERSLVNDHQILLSTRVGALTTVVFLAGTASSIVATVFNQIFGKEPWSIASPPSAALNILVYCLSVVSFFVLFLFLADVVVFRVKQWKSGNGKH